MSLMRTYRAALTLSQSAFAARLNVPLETYRTWDSGRREPSKEFLSRARTLAAHPDDKRHRRHGVTVMASDPASSPTVEEALRSAVARFALLADVLELQADPPPMVVPVLMRELGS